MGSFKEQGIKGFRFDDAVYSSILIDFAPRASAVMPVRASSITP
jgi:hypothetical protein